VWTKEGDQGDSWQAATIHSALSSYYRVTATRGGGIRGDIAIDNLNLIWCTEAPTATPTNEGDTHSPTTSPTAVPTASPTVAPTSAPTLMPTAPTSAPTLSPASNWNQISNKCGTSCQAATIYLASGSYYRVTATCGGGNCGDIAIDNTDAPTATPRNDGDTHAPTVSPSAAPTAAPTDAPTSSPTSKPTPAATSVASNNVMAGNMPSFPFGSLRLLQFAAVPLLTTDSCEAQLNAMQEQHNMELNMLQKEHQMAVLRLCAGVPEDTLCQGASTPSPTPNPRQAGPTLPASATTIIPRSVHHISYSLDVSQGGVSSNRSLIAYLHCRLIE
jgi:hypothetical protein